MFQNPWTQLRGTTVENFVAESQDKSRSALAKSLEAAFLAWEEQLKGDQAMFDAEAIRSSAYQRWSFDR